MLKKYGDLLSGVFLLILSIALFIGSFGVKRLTISSIGSGFVPQVVAVLLAIVSAVIIWHGIVDVRKKTPTVKSKKKTQCAPEDAEKLHLKGLLFTLGLITVYIAALAPVGFLISTAVYLFLQITVLATKEQRKYPLFIIISILTSTSVYFIFIKVFHLMLPAGILG
jgi:putative tricarboxylic transport membrane protein